jgi:putative drug exporter of the RND superfamily
MLDFLGQWASKHPWKTLTVWCLVAVVSTLFAPNWQKNATDDDIRFLPGHYPSVRGHALLEAAFPEEVCASRAIITLERTDRTPLTTEDLTTADDLIQHLRVQAKTQPAITRIASFREGPVGSRLIANDRRCLLIPIALSTPYLAIQTRDALDGMDAALQARPIPHLETTITGAAGVGRDLVTASGKSLDQTTWATIGLVVIVLLGVYRSPWLALIPLVTIGIAVWISLQLLALLTLIPGVQLVHISQVFAIVILFGAGTDYCLFLIARYREELEWGLSPADGLPRALRAVSGALVGSAGTVICGLGMMGFAEFGKIRCAGPVIALALVVGLLPSVSVSYFGPGNRKCLAPDKSKAASGTAPAGWFSPAPGLSSASP